MAGFTIKIIPKQSVGGDLLYQTFLKNTSTGSMTYVGASKDRLIARSYGHRALGNARS